jgi:MFS family permease
MVVLALASSQIMLIVGWTIVTLMIPIYFATSYSYRVTLVPDHLQGRVNSIYRLLVYSGSALGPAIGGLLLQPLGPGVMLWLIAAGMALCALLLGFTGLGRA